MRGERWVSVLSAQDRRNRAVLSALVVLVVLLALVPLLRLAAQAQQQRWTTACRNDGGTVDVLPAGQPNPFLAQPKSPVYRCRGTDGRILRTRR